MLCLRTKELILHLIIKKLPSVKQSLNIMSSNDNNQVSNECGTKNGCEVLLSGSKVPLPESPVVKNMVDGDVKFKKLSNDEGSAPKCVSLVEAITAFDEETYKEEEDKDYIPGERRLKLALGALAEEEGKVFECSSLAESITAFDDKTYKEEEDEDYLPEEVEESSSDSSDEEKLDESSADSSDED